MVPWHQLMHDFRCNGQGRRSCVATRPLLVLRHFGCLASGRSETEACFEHPLALYRYCPIIARYRQAARCLHLSNTRLSTSRLVCPYEFSTMPRYLTTLCPPSIDRQDGFRKLTLVVSFEKRPAFSESFLLARRKHHS